MEDEECAGAGFLLYHFSSLHYHISHIVTTLAIYSTPWRTKHNIEIFISETGICCINVQNKQYESKEALSTIVRSLPPYRERTLIKLQGISYE